MSHRSPYLAVTNRIVEAMKRGQIPWHRPWSNDGPPASALTGRSYRGVNKVLLEFTAIERGYTSHRWLTYRAAKREGGYVRAGEKGTLVVYYQRYDTPTPGRPSGDIEVGDRCRFYAAAYYLFNLDQCDGLDHLTTEELVHFDPDSQAEAILIRSGVPLVHGGDQAFYHPATDTIHLPHRSRFSSASGYYCSAFHEVAHATGAPNRLNRLQACQMGDRTYAFEELVAELTAAYLCQECGLAVDVSQTAAYLSSWITLCSDNPRAFVAAAREAQRATDYILADVSGAGDEPVLHVPVGSYVDDPESDIIAMVHREAVKQRLT